MTCLWIYGIDSHYLTAPGSRMQKTKQNVHRRGLACAVGTQKPENLPLRDFEGDSLEGILDVAPPPKCFAQFYELDGWNHYASLWKLECPARTEHLSNT